jgi:hypothetical protein
VGAFAAFPVGVVVDQVATVSQGCGYRRCRQGAWGTLAVVRVGLQGSRHGGELIPKGPGSGADEDTGARQRPGHLPPLDSGR